MDRRGFFKSILALGVAHAASPLIALLPVPSPVYAAPAFTLDALYAETWKQYRYEVLKNLEAATPLYGWIQERAHGRRSVRVSHASNT